MLERKNQNQHQLFCASHHVNCSFAFVSVTSTAVCLFAFCIRRQTKNKTTCTPKRRASECSMCHIHCCVSFPVLHINCRLFVCLSFSRNKAHAHKKTQIKLFHAGLEITCTTCKRSQSYNYKSRKKTSAAFLSPLLNCALSGDRICKKTSLSDWCMNSYGSSCCVP